MEWEKLLDEAREATGRRQYRDAIEIYKSILEESKEEEPQVYYSSLKAIADLLGHKGIKDYMNAIEVYQKIINEYEDAPDELFDWCQAEIAATYLFIGMENLDNFDNLNEIVNMDNTDISVYLDKLMEKRELFILAKADSIYKTRM
jgi:tetratricopeptide (TPR) repeat protein